MNTLLHHHKVGTEYITKALEIDEKSEKKNEAIEYYKLGIEEFLLGLTIKLDGEEAQRGCRMQEKMESNLNMALERVEFLNHSSPRLDQIKENYEKTKLQRQLSRQSSTDQATANRLINEVADKLKAFSYAPAATNNKVPPPKTTAQVKRPTSARLSSATGNSRPSTSKKSTPVANKSAATTSNPVNPATEKMSIGKKLKIPNVEEKLVNFILDEIVDVGQSVKFSDVAGQEKAKQALNELVILPALNPEIFTGLRSPIKGLLLFGPPGNGKTLLAKAVANEANCKFFNISAASLTSKYVGEGEKLVRALFGVATYLQPAIIFIDEIDSLLFERRDNDHEASRRLKTEFLTQFDGMQSNNQDRILVMGATNRPYELDNAALRRFPKRIYIGLPDTNTRMSMLNKLMGVNQSSSTLSSSDLRELARLTDGYSGSDLTALAKDAALGPIREKSVEVLKTLTPNNIRPINMSDFRSSLMKIRQSTPRDSLGELEKWNREYGDINA